MPNDNPDWTQAAAITAGTIDATITNADITVTPAEDATFPVSGSIDATISNSSLTIDGGPITVENVEGNLLGTNQPQTLLAGPVTVDTNDTEQTVGTDLSLPAATHAVLFAWVGLGGPTSVRVVGVTSGIDWASFPPVVTGNRIAFIVPESIDSKVSIYCTFPGDSGTTTVWATALLDTLVTVADQGQATPVAIEPGSTNVAVGAAVDAYTSDASLALRVTDQYAYPAPWRVPRAHADVDGTNGTSVELVPAATSGEDTYLHWFNLQLGTAAVVGKLVGHTSGVVLASLYPAAANAMGLNKDFKGAKLEDLTGVAGEALYLIASSSQFFYAGLDYTQAAAD